MKNVTRRNKIINTATPVAGRFVSQYSTERWVTAEHETYQLAFMQTSHMFFAFRMLYDEAAERFGWPRMRAPGEGRQAASGMSKEKLAKKMAWFATDIMLRDDLAAEHRPQFMRMLNRLLQNYNVKFLEDRTLKVEWSSQGGERLT